MFYMRETSGKCRWQSMDIHPYTLLSLFSALISLIASFSAWRRPKGTPGSLLLSLLLLSMAIWSGSYSTRWMDISIEAKSFWLNVMFLGIASLPTLFCLFVIALTRNDAWLTRRN